MPVHHACFWPQKIQPCFHVSRLFSQFSFWWATWCLARCRRLILPLRCPHPAPHLHPHRQQHASWISGKFCCFRCDSLFVHNELAAAVFLSTWKSTCSAMLFNIAFFTVLHGIFGWSPLSFCFTALAGDGRAEEECCLLCFTIALENAATSDFDY